MASRAPGDLAPGHHPGVGGERRSSAAYCCRPRPRQARCAAVKTEHTFCLRRLAVQPGRFSRTAEFMALFRALESVRPAGKALFRDPFAQSFIDPALRPLVRWSAVPLAGVLLRTFIDRFWPGARTSGVARTRLIDDWVAEAIAKGCRQLVVLGAGFDSRAWRLPDLFSLPVFQVDPPSTPPAKAGRLQAPGPDPSRAVPAPLYLHRNFL